MRLAPLAMLSAGLVAWGLALTGCAANAPQESAAPSEPAAPPPAPSITPVVIGAAEMPPVAFGGDCAKALSPDDIAEVLGVDVAPEATTPDEWTMNVGGVRCEWRDADGNPVILDVIPRAGLDGAVFPDELAPYLFERCTGGSPCAWQGGDDSAWVALALVAPDGADADDVEVWGEALGARVLENYAAAAADPWTRDRTGWFRALDCAQVGAAVGAQLGSPVTGLTSGWDADLPPAGYVMALEGSQQASCRLTLEDGQGASVTIWPGLGGALAAERAAQVDLGVPGITAYEGGPEDARGRDYILTDGVNRIDLWMRTDDVEAQRRLALALAAAAASDFL